MRLGLVLLIHLLLLVNVQFTPWPELHLWPYLMENGYKIYQDIAFEKPPVLPLLLFFWFNIFGNSLVSLKILTWIIILITDLLIYKTSKSTLAVLFYALLMVGFTGNALWYDLLLAPIFLLLFLSLKRKNYFIAGILFAFSVLIKQPAIATAIPIWLQLKSKPLQKKQSFFRGLFLVLFPTLFWLLVSQNLDDAFMWVIKFPSTIAKLSFQLPTVKIAIIPLLMASSLILTYKANSSVSLWGLISLLFLYPRFELFHFQTSLPFIALALSGIKTLSRNVILLLTTLVLLVFSLRQIVTLWRQPDRFYESTTASISTWIKFHTLPGDKIYLLNTWDHIYVLSQTVPATQPWYHYLPWYLAFPGVQEEIVSDLKEVKPKLIISEALSREPNNQIESFVYSYYFPSAIINDRFTVWTPRL